MRISYRPLWHTLIDLNLTPAQMRKITGISPETLARMRKDKCTSLDTVGKVCSALNVPVSAVIEYRCAQEEVQEEVQEVQ